MSQRETTIERNMKSAAASVEIEGFTLTEEHKKLVKKILMEEMSLDEAIEIILKKDE